MASFEFVRIGTPCTVQTANRSRLANYKQDVRRCARLQWPGDIPPTGGPVKVVIAYYYSGLDDIDVDNIIKPILDQLNGLVYRDDIQIVEITCRKQKLPVSDTVIEVTSPDLERGLRSREAFIHIRAEWEPAMEDQGKSKKDQPDRVRETAQLYRLDRHDAVSAEAVDRTVEQLLASAAEGTELTLVRLYAALDAALLYAFVRVGLRPRSTESQSILVVGTSRCFLEQSEYATLSRLMKIRDAIVNGDDHEQPSYKDLLLLAELTHRVIVEAETAKLEYDY